MIKSKNNIIPFSILKNSQYNLIIFPQEKISSLEKLMFLIKRSLNIKCIILDKEAQLKYWEIIRQIYMQKLINHYVYLKKWTRFEHFNREGQKIKSVDITDLK